MKSTYVAIIAVVIIAIAAVGVYFAFFNNGGSENYAVDEIVREDLREGDYVSIDMSGASLTNRSLSGAEASEVVESLTYYDGEKTGMRSITYKDDFFMADVYEFSFGEYTSEYYVHPQTGIVYGQDTYLTGMTLEYRLRDTNIDISQSAEDLTVEKGSYIEMKTVMKTAWGPIDLEFSGNTITLVTAVNDGLYDCSIITDLIANSTPKLEVERVYLDTVKIVGIDEPIEKTAFLAFISKDDFIAYVESQGATLEPKSKTVSVEEIDGYGKRKVSTEVFKMTVDSDNGELTLIYGEKGVLYRATILQQSENLAETSIIELKGSNLVSVPN